MFGLTKREQRWKAENEALKALVELVSVMVKADAEVQIAKAQADAAKRQPSESVETRYAG